MVMKACIWLYAITTAVTVLVVLPPITNGHQNANTPACNQHCH